MRRMYWWGWLFVLCFAIGGNVVHAEPARSVSRVWIDTDMGVDDAVAVAMLLQSDRVQVLGISTVAGNTTVQNATRNVLTLLQVVQRHPLVVQGAEAPLQRTRPRIGALLHGPDGLRGAQLPLDTQTIGKDVPAALHNAITEHPDMVIVALGPATNLAQTAAQYASTWTQAHVVWLGGSKYGGNQTPVAEFNAYADPEAADALFVSGANVTNVTQDRFNTPLDATQVLKQIDKQGALGSLLHAPVQTYFTAQTQGAEGAVRLPDVWAALVVLHPRAVAAQSALIDVETTSTLTRGVTVIALTTNERIGLIATDEQLSSFADSAFSDPTFHIQTAIGQLLLSRPDNALFVTNIAINNMQQWWR